MNPLPRTHREHEQSLRLVGLTGRAAFSGLLSAVPVGCVPRPLSVLRPPTSRCVGRPLPASQVGDLVFDLLDLVRDLPAFFVAAFSFWINVAEFCSKAD